MVERAREIEIDKKGREEVESERERETERERDGERREALTLSPRLVEK